MNQVAAQKHGSTVSTLGSGGRYAGRSVRAKAARGSTRSSSSSSSSMEVDLPPTAALDQQDLLGGQLKRRREAEQECRRLEGENLKLRGSLGDLEAMVAVLEEENAQFGAERERLEGEIEALREQKDEAVAGAGALKKKVEGAYPLERGSRARRSKAAGRRGGRRSRPRTERRGWRGGGSRPGPSCAGRGRTTTPLLPRWWSADQAAREELELRVTATSKTSEAATRAASGPRTP